ncbi:MAG: PAS domain S-box protein [Bacillota bacterium]
MTGQDNQKHEKAARETAAWYKDIVDHARDLIQCVDSEGRFIYVNQTWLSTLNYTAEEIDNLTLWDIIHPDSMEHCMAVFEQVLTTKNFGEVKAIFVAKDGTWITIEGNIGVKLDENGRFVYTCGIFRNVTNRKEVEENRRYQFELEKLVSEISAYLGSLSAEQLNEGISTALKMAGEYFQVDRSYIFQFSSDGLTRNLTHEWCAAGVKPQKERLQNQPLTNLPWWTETVKSKRCIHIPEADSLPPKAEGEKREFKAQKLNSLIYVPIIKTGQLIGVLGFDAIKQKIEWTKEHETHLLILAELISSALTRYQAEEALKASEEKYREILSTIEDGYYEVDLAGNFVFFNDSFCKTLGYSRDELMQASYKKLYKNPQQVFQTYNRVYQTGIAEKAADWPVTTKDGQEIFIEVSITLRRDEAGNQIGFRGIARDVTERRLAEEKLRKYEELQQLMMHLATERINVPLKKVDQAINEMLETVGKFTKADRVYIFKHDYDRRVTSNTYEWCTEGITPEIDNLQATPLDYFPDILEAHQKGEVVHIPDIARMPADHAMHPLFKAQGIQSMIMLPIFSEDINTGFVGFDAVKQKRVFTKQEINLLKALAEIISNVLERQKTETNIHYISFHDQLTGLYNRYFLGEEIERFNTKRQLPLTVIMADLNSLKLVNDTYGHETGDQLLKTAANILRNSCREEDIIARWGGDEFVVILPQTEERDAQLICKRITEGCRGTFVKDVPVSIALGLATKTSETTNPLETLQEAENDMYRQKLTGSRSTKSALVTSLLNTLAEKSFETEKHTRGIQTIAQKIGTKLNLPDSELHRLDLLITLHDIGKINISEGILTKKSSLTDDEWAVIKKHPEIGCRIAMATEQFAHVANDILAHHERWDGTGYPKGLKENSIPLLARIVAIADAYEVMSSGRPYKKAMSKNEIIAEYKKCAGTHFDPELVKIILPIIEADE